MKVFNTPIIIGIMGDSWGLKGIMDSFPEVMTTTEAMKYLKVSRKTLLKLVHQGSIPARKVGKDFRYLKSEIDSYLRGEKEINYFKG